MIRLSDRRPSTVWGVLDDACDLYRRHFTLFAGITALVLVPYSLVDNWWELRLYGPGGSNSDSSGALFLPYISVSVPLLTLATILQTAATASAVEDIFFGRQTSVFSAYRRVLARLRPLLGASLLYIALTWLGVLTLFVVTFIVMVRYAFIAQVVVLENRGARAAGPRSRDLAAGSGDKVFGLLMLLLLFSLVLWGMVSALLETAFYLLPFLKAGDVAAQQMREFVITEVANDLGEFLVSPLAPLAMTLLYYDRRVRREGLDIEMKATELGLPLAPDAFGGDLNPRNMGAPSREGAGPDR